MGSWEHRQGHLEDAVERQLDRAPRGSWLPGCQRGLEKEEIERAGFGVRREGRRPGGCWVRGAAKNIGDWGMRIKAGEVLLREGIVVSCLLSQGSPQVPSVSSKPTRMHWCLQCLTQE